ncbi:MAG TPA: hypothetical protein VM487_22855, partial [Phycisphaerae bacterium]|nr:hypothetical protein [Phycisphaerae bacterium]
VHNYVSKKLGSTVRQDQTKHHAVKFFGPADRIWVYIDGKTRYLGELSEIVCGMPERIWRGRIYADDNIRKRVKSFCDKWLSDNPSAGGVTDVAGKS